MSQTAKEKGEALLQENATKEGTTASALLDEVRTEGTGQKPGPVDAVRVPYRGTLFDGTECDSSYKRWEPISFRLNQVFPGWTEGLPLMSERGRNTASVFLRIWPMVRAERAA